MAPRRFISCGCDTVVECYLTYMALRCAHMHACARAVPCLRDRFPSWSVVVRCLMIGRVMGWWAA